MRPGAEIIFFTEHILEGRPVEWLRFHAPGPGGQTLGRTAGGRPVERCTLCRSGQAITYAVEREPQT